MTLPEFKCWLEGFMWETEYPSPEQWALIKQRLNEVTSEVKHCSCRNAWGQSWNQQGVPMLTVTNPREGLKTTVGDPIGNPYDHRLGGGLAAELTNEGRIKAMFSQEPSLSTTPEDLEKSLL